MSWFRPGFASLLLAWGGAVSAQAPAMEARAEGLRLEPPPSLAACLKAEPGATPRPVYPADALKAGLMAVVRARLVFSGPDRPPEVAVEYNSSDPAFEQAVRDHVAAYRMPCVRADAPPFRATQVFNFVVKDVYSGPLRDDGERRAPWSASCLDQSSRAVSAVYPRKSIQSGEQGNVLLRLKFVAPDAAPDVVVLYDGGSAALSAEAARVARSYRLPCLESGQPPVFAILPFSFRIDGDAYVRLKPDLALKELLRLVRGLQQERVRFDTNGMGCPFQLEFRPFRPYEANEVGDVGPAHPNRREFVEWLRTLQLDIGPKAARYVIGQTVTVNVPCAVLDLS